MKDKKLLEEIKAIAKRVLQTNISLEEFYKLWPSENTNKFLEDLYEDLEEGIEHIPGFLLKNQVNNKEWQSSYLYFKVLVDLKLLDYMDSFDLDKLNSCRIKLFNKNNWRNINLKNEIQNCINDMNNQDKNV